MNKYKDNMPKFIIVVIMLLVLILCYYFYNRSLKNYNNLKIDKSKNLVYTESIMESGLYLQYKPYLNIKNETGTLINNDITSYIGNFTRENTCILYEYNINGKILSLVIKVFDHSYAESSTILYFRTYNINLKNSEILSNEKILNYFDLTDEDVKNKLNQRVEEYYYSLVDSGLILEKECDYDCFLKSGEFQEGLDDVNYYIKDGVLTVFKPYVSMLQSFEDDKEYDFKITNNFN